ncbi:MAG: type ISP restriction/modification enzyme [Pyrinomonadaceae bacterium]
MAKIYYARVDEFWRKEQKYAYLEECQHVGNVEWQELKPDAKNNWLTEENSLDYETFFPLGSREAKSSQGFKVEAVFKTYSPGAQTNRDDWMFNFDSNALGSNVKRFINTYNEQVNKWITQRKQGDTVDSFVSYDDSLIKWSSSLKAKLKAQASLSYKMENVRQSFYRPYVAQYLYFDDALTHRRGQFHHFYPNSASEKANIVIAVTGHSQIPFSALTVNRIPSLDVGGRAGQCFPFYTYNEDGTNRRENITDWALEQFRAHYKDQSITKWNIFHYVYALLHHPVYRECYAANLKRELPRIPFAPDFQSFAHAGARLSELHVHYEQQPEYPLEAIETPNTALDWRVEKMRLSKDKRSLVYNDFLTLGNIPPEIYEYRLGNRSALEWVIDQYQVSTDKRSGITNDPNRADDPQYIKRLIGQVITVSLETMKIVRALPALNIKTGGQEG